MNFDVLANEILTADESPSETAERNGGGRPPSHVTNGTDISRLLSFVHGQPGERARDASVDRAGRESKHNERGRWRP